MAFDLNNMIKETIDKLKTMLESDSVVGSPIKSGDTTIVPVSKLSFGFVTGGYDMKTRTVKINEGSDEQPIAAIGGGVTVTPIGFILFSEDSSATFIKTQGDNTDKWLDIVQSTIKKAIKR